MFGCFASALVAFMIEISNVIDKNKKANNTYEMVYFDLHFEIKAFLECWSKICSVIRKDRDYKLEEHIWKEWYALTKDYCFSCEPSKQKELNSFIVDQIEFHANRLVVNLESIEHQRFILEINNVFNSSNNIYCCYCF